MFYHIFIAFEDPDAKYSRTKDLLRADFSLQETEHFLGRYRQGLPLIFEGNTHSLKLLRAIKVGYTEQRSTIILPPIKAEFNRNEAMRLAQKDEENRRNKIVVLPYPGMFHYFHADSTLMSLALDRTADFIQTFTSLPQEHASTGHVDLETEGLGPAQFVTLQQQRRFRYLTYLYQASSAGSSRMFHWREVGNALGMSDDIAASACCYLRQKDLANGEYMTDGISQAGIDEYEQAIMKPDQPTEHFPQHVTINTGHSSNVMMSSPGAHQTLTSHTLPADLASVADLIRDLRQVLPELGIEPDLREDVEIQIAGL